MSLEGFVLRVDSKDEDEDPEEYFGPCAYLKLPVPKDATGGKVKRTVRLWDLLGPYEGSDLHFDFDHNGRLVGIEILP